MSDDDWETDPDFENDITEEEQVRQTAVACCRLPQSRLRALSSSFFAVPVPRTVLAEPRSLCASPSARSPAAPASRLAALWRQDYRLRDHERQHAGPGRLHQGGLRDGASSPQQMNSLAAASQPTASRSDRASERAPVLARCVRGGLGIAGADTCPSAL